jgi:large subunit ribosomal protein L18
MSKMLNKKKSERAFMRQSRHQRVRKKISGTSDRPRLCIFRSLNHIYAQVIDDTAGHTLVSVSSIGSDIQARLAEQGNRVAKSRVVGQILGEKARELGISQVTFDRAGYRYHGRIQAFAEGAREGGLEF